MSHDAKHDRHLIDKEDRKAQCVWFRTMTRDQLIKLDQASTVEYFRILDRETQDHVDKELGPDADAIIDAFVSAYKANDIEALTGATVRWNTAPGIVAVIAWSRLAGNDTRPFLADAAHRSLVIEAHSRTWERILNILGYVLNKDQVTDIA